MPNPICRVDFEVRGVETRLPEQVGKPVILTVWWSTDVLVTRDGLDALRNRWRATAERIIAEERERLRDAGTTLGE